MTDDTTNEPSSTANTAGNPSPERAGHHKPHDGHRGPKGPGYRPRTIMTAVAGVALLAFGAAAGAGAIAMTRPSVEMAPMTPVAISSIADDSLVTVKGKVVEIFGNKIVVEDGTGRALIETGREGEGGKLVTKDETVSFQGRFDDGFIRASYLMRADGKTEALGPVRGPGHGPEHRPDHGPKHDKMGDMIRRAID